MKMIENAASATESATRAIPTRRFAAAVESGTVTRSSDPPLPMNEAPALQ
jgi:hypothetical protein